MMMNEPATQALMALKETTLETLKSDDTELLDVVFCFSATNMQERHAEATSYIIQKLSIEIEAVLDKSDPNQAELCKELTYGHLLAARYLASAKIFVVNAPDKLTHFIREHLSQFEFATPTNAYKLTVERVANLDDIGMTKKETSSIEWLELNVAPGTTGSPAQHKDDIARALDAIGLKATKINLVRRDVIKYNVTFVTQANFDVSKLPELFNIRLGQGKFTTPFLSPEWRNFLEVYRCCLSRTCFCNQRGKKRGLAKLDRNTDKTRQCDMNKKRFEHFNFRGAGPSSL